MQALVIDDHPLARCGVATILERGGLPPALQADDSASALTIAREQRPDVVVMDLHLPESLPPRELCQQLKAILPDVPILLLTAGGRTEDIRACFEAGANGCLTKDSAEQDLIDAINGVVSGKTVIDPRTAQRLAVAVVSGGSDRGPHLTGREAEVLHLLAEGRSNRRIADGLCLSEATVKGHVSALLDKLDATSRLEAVVVAKDAGLI